MSMLASASISSAHCYAVLFAGEIPYTMLSTTSEGMSRIPSDPNTAMNVYVRSYNIRNQQKSQKTSSTQISPAIACLACGGFFIALSIFTLLFMSTTTNIIFCVIFFSLGITSSAVGGVKMKKLADEQSHATNHNP